MTHADHIGEDTQRIQLWMLPVLLAQIIFDLFRAAARGHVTRLRKMRRGKLPADWWTHHDRLGEVEWHIRVLLAEGARQIFAGKAFDFHSILIPDPPEDTLWAPPGSAWLTHMRFEAVARFHSDPETYVRRLAQRILAHEARKRFGLVMELVEPGALICAIPRRLAAPHAEFAQTRVLIPP